MTQNGNLTIKRVPLTELHQDPSNARTHDERNVAAIQASLKTFGQVEPLVVQKGTGRIIGGNGRLDAIKNLGQTEVDVVEVECDDMTATALGIALNRTSELAAWDDDVLAGHLKALADADFDELVTGFDMKEIEALISGAAGEVAEDEVPEPPADPVTKPGDLWVLGEHRVLCGDATERDAYSQLLGGVKPTLLLTDPPYGVAYQDAGGSRIQGDLTQAAFPIALSCCAEVIDENARLYVFCATDQVTMADRVFTHLLGMRPRLLVWAKESFILRHNGYHSQYEMVCYGWRGSGGGPKFWYGDRKQSDVWDICRDGDRVHPTQKPVEVCCIPIRNSSASREPILDPFLGSGTTLIAAEQLGRRAYGIEIEPRYVDVVIQRWENLTGKKAERTHAETADGQVR